MCATPRGDSNRARSGECRNLLEGLVPARAWGFKSDGAVHVAKETRIDTGIHSDDSATVSRLSHRWGWACREAHPGPSPAIAKRPGQRG
jgi:hypothetical protein